MTGALQDWLFSDIALNMTPTIRKAITGDGPGIHDSHMCSIREVCIADHGANEVSGWGNRPYGDYWETSIVDKSVHLWVVECDGRIEGHAGMRIKDPQRASVFGLYLTPIVLGKGLGKQLLSLMISAAQREGVACITLDSTITAHRFYMKNGFVDTNTIQTGTIGGSTVRYFPMKFTL